MTPLNEYFILLANHNWRYNSSGDEFLYQRGRVEQLRLEATAKESPEHDKLFCAWKKYSLECGPEPLLVVESVGTAVGIGVTFES